MVMAIITIVITIKTTATTNESINADINDYNYNNFNPRERSCNSCIINNILSDRCNNSSYKISAITLVVVRAKM